MVYDRRIRYLDYCRNGERIKGGGFARTEINGDFFKLELTLKGIMASEGKMAEVFLTDPEGEAVLGKVRIENGGGVFRYQGNLKRDLKGREVLVEGLTGIRIPISEEVQVSCSWPAEKGGIRAAAGESADKGNAEEVDRPEGQEQERKEKLLWSERRKQGRKEESAQPEGQIQERKEESLWESTERAETERLSAEEYSEKQPSRSSKERRESEPEERTASEKEAGNTDETRRIRTVKLLEDKWRQLSAIYPHIRPFRDERDYLSLGPADFVLFTEESYRTVNNSFLLHGYYNYHHLILTRMERRGESVYYLGVPGSYFEREKQVAVMFGFESFECAEEPAQEGDFGYYMMKVSL